MYLLDTNIVSEIRKGAQGDTNVLNWARAASASSLFLSVITILEIEAGIRKKERKDPPQGAMLRSWLNSRVLPTFSDRILNIDLAVVVCCAKLHIPDPCSERDALISATALVHGLIVVTRNIKDFKETGVELLNPWEVVI